MFVPLSLLIIGPFSSMNLKNSSFLHSSVGSLYYLTFCQLITWLSPGGQALFKRAE